MNKRVKKKPPTLSTEVFVGKVVAPLFNEHELFNKPTEIKKVFRSIGLPNFKDETTVAKCFVDLKKNGSYVWNLLQTITDLLASAKEGLTTQADNIQYLATTEEREKNKGKITEIYVLTKAIGFLLHCVDPHQRDVIGETMQNLDSRIVLKLYKDIIDPNEKTTFNGVEYDKKLYKKGQSWQSIYKEIREKCASFDVRIAALETTEAGRVFDRENIPNKKFHIVFSSEGSEGVWDIATMSMRGFKSCQRWDGEYPRCLIGSIFSRFVGVMYLTSGVAAENYLTANGITYSNLGTKMIRRCVVRYAIDADQEKPCILLDKMYPELDKDILNVFIETITKRTSLPVYYSPELGNKTRHMYVPNEQIRNEIAEREWSYQDTPLKSRNDLNTFYLSHNEDEVKKYVKGVQINLALFLARKLEDIYTGDIIVEQPVKKVAYNIRMNTAFMPFTELAARYILDAFRAPTAIGIMSSKVYYRKYLLEFIKQRKNIQSYASPNITATMQNYSSKEFDTKEFLNYLFELTVRFCKVEATSLFS